MNRNFDVVAYRILEAERALQRGWVFTPLNGKKPIVKDWTEQPPPSLQQVCEWARAGNLGLRTGRISGVFVIDIDPAKGGDAVSLRLPRTPLVRTGGGGFHHYFAAPDEHLGNSISRIGPGIDSRGDGGQVVFPGSIHPHTGLMYRWAPGLSPEDIPLAPLPKEVLALLRRSANTGGTSRASGPVVSKRYAAAALQRELNKVCSAAESTRNNTLNIAAFNLGQLIGAGLITEEVVVERLRESALAVGLSEREAIATIQSGIRAGAEQPRRVARKPKHQPTDQPESTTLISLDSARLERQGGRSGSGVGERRLPEIDAADGNLPRMAKHAWSALAKANDPPHWFRYGSVPSRIEQDDKRLPIVRTLNKDRLRFILARVATWSKVTTAGVTEVPPPKIVVSDMLARPDPPLPILTRIVEVPVFAADGTLQSEPGYHPLSRVFYAPPEGLALPPTPENPSPDEIERARSLIVDDLLVDFPFTSDSERAHAIALGLLPFVRDLIDGPTPLHLLEKPSPGTGATLLVYMLLYPALGHPVATMTEGRDEDEWRKRITAKLLQGPVAILIDNLRHRLESAAFSSAITAPQWEDRILGHSEMARIPVRCAWAATGNNPTVSDEIARRAIRVRLDAKTDQPWLRQRFKHRNLREWVREHRAELVSAFLTLVRAWLAAGRPQQPYPKSLGMFEEWSAVMGGILAIAGIKGFLGNLDEFYEASDTEAASWRTFVGVWFEKFSEQPVGVKQLFELVQDKDIFDLGDKNEKSQRTRLGRLIGKQRDRQFGDYRIVTAGEAHGAKQWRLQAVSGLGSGSGQ